MESSLSHSSWVDCSLRNTYCYEVDCRLFACTPRDAAWHVHMLCPGDIPRAQEHSHTDSSLRAEHHHATAAVAAGRRMRERLEYGPCTVVAAVVEDVVVMEVMEPVLVEEIDIDDACY